MSDPLRPVVPSRTLVLTLLLISMLIAVVLSPLASRNPDGLNRVAQDLGFEHRASEQPPAHNLPFYGLFNQYALRHVPPAIATPLAGLLGTGITFGLTWGLGKLVTRRSRRKEK